MKKIIFTDEQKIDIFNKYQKEGKTLKSIGEEYGISSSTISRLLKENQIETRTSIKNEIGNRYGKLVVIEYAGSDENHRALWKCKCDCGNNNFIAKGKYLRNGDTKSCGCLTTCNDLLHKRFGKLEVIAKTDKRIFKSVVWTCKCDCGNIKDYPSKMLITGDAISCGLCSCKSKGELKIQEILENNNIIFSREYKNATCKDSHVLPFDFAIFKNDKLEYLIEFDGIQHFEASRQGWDTIDKLEITQKHDNIKNNWCKKNNIPLIRIPYTHYNDLCLEDLLLNKTNYLVCNDKNSTTGKSADAKKLGIPVITEEELLKLFDF